MGEVIHIKDYYERKADAILDKMKRSWDPEHRMKLAVDYSVLQAKITRFSYRQFRQEMKEIMVGD